MWSVIALAKHAVATLGPGQLLLLYSKLYQSRPYQRRSTVASDGLSDAPTGPGRYLTSARQLFYNVNVKWAPRSAIVNTIIYFIAL